MQRLSSASARPWFVAASLLALCAISYGSMAAKLGYYWDDWTIVWYIRFLGPSSFNEAFAFDRPLLAPIYALTTSLLGEAPLNWQIFAIFTRWLACVALWWALRGLWPDKPVQTAAIAALFAVYPGFKQGYIAITYGNAFIVLALYFASWGLMIWAWRKPRWFWQLYLASLFLNGYCIFAAEHFFGLELLRPIFLWIVLSGVIKERRQRITRLFLAWLPYLLTALIFLFWRMATPTPRANIMFLENLKEDPAVALLNIAQTALQDVFESSMLAWGQALNISWLEGQTANILIKYVVIFLLVLVGMIIVLGTLHRTEEQPDISSRRRWALQGIIIGIFALFVAGIPIWPTDLRIELFFPWDRFTLPMMFGAALLLVGIIELIAWRPNQSIILVALFSGLAAGMHFQNALSFRKDWLIQRDFFWQLTWRMPGLQPGTVLLTTEMPFQYDWDNSLTAPLNWTYAPQLNGRELPYLIYNAESRLSRGLPDLEADTQIREYLRITPFKGSISQAVLVFFQPPGACLKVIDPALDQDFPDKPRYFRDIYTFSRPELIIPQGQPSAVPPLDFFGPEPEKEWCYYYEKADLARQFEDWQQVAALGDQAFDRSKKIFNRRNVTELLPFVEGYAHTGRWETAAQLTLQALDAWENASDLLCGTWDRIRDSTDLDAQGSSTLEQIQETLQCQPK